MLHILIDNQENINVPLIRSKIDSLIKQNIINIDEQVVISHYQNDATKLDVKIKNNCFIFSYNNYIDLKNIPLYLYLKTDKLNYDYKYIYIDNVNYKIIDKIKDQFVFENSHPVAYTLKKDLVKILGGFKAIDDLNIVKSNPKEDNYLETSVYSLDVDYLIRYLFYIELQKVIDKEKGKLLTSEYSSEGMKALQSFIKETIDKINKAEPTDKPDLYYYNHKSNGKLITETYFLWLNTLYNRKIKKFSQYVILDKFYKAFKYLKNPDFKTRLAQESYIKSVIHTPIFSINSDYDVFLEYVQNTMIG